MGYRWQLRWLPPAPQLLSPQALLARRLAVLTSAAQDMPERQQTLRKALACSYDLLSPAEQRLFRTLSAFTGGCELAAAEVVCSTGGDRAFSVLDGAASLLGKSFLQRTEQQTAEPCFLMLETLREYGLECLVASGEMEAARRAHALYYLTLA